MNRMIVRRVIPTWVLALEYILTTPTRAVTQQVTEEITVTKASRPWAISLSSKKSFDRFDQ